MNNGDTPILLKTKELCQTILTEPEYRQIRLQVEKFMADPNAQSQYQQVVEKGEYLQHKQQMGAPISDDDVAEFEKNRDTLVNNPVVKGFLDAQEAMHRVQQSVNQYVLKTFELGRLPTEEDFSGGCGSGCGCHH
jgi:cell fate (sporulation/competence/biofilm development) regulator YlbF (YheA/YmcA/DUF963 family)